MKLIDDGKVKFDGPVLSALTGHRGNLMVFDYKDMKALYGLRPEELREYIGTLLIRFKPSSGWLELRRPKCHTCGDKLWVVDVDHPVDCPKCVVTVNLDITTKDGTIIFQHETEKPSIALTLRTPDSNGEIPDPAFIGQMLRHNKRGKMYMVLEYCWMGETDTWGFIHKEVAAPYPGSLAIVRPISHLKGVTKDGKSRYSFL